MSEETIIEVMDNEPCETHNLENRKLGYVEWHEWARGMDDKGETQTKCSVCKYHLFNCEL